MFVLSTDAWKERKMKIQKFTLAGTKIHNHLPVNSTDVLLCVSSDNISCVFLCFVKKLQVSSNNLLSKNSKAILSVARTACVCREIPLNFGCLNLIPDISEIHEFLKCFVAG